MVLMSLNRYGRGSKICLAPAHENSLGGPEEESVEQLMCQSQLSKFDLYETCKDLFYPNGLSIFGTPDEMIMDLSNFKEEKIDKTITVGGSILPFSISNYMEAHIIVTVRIYLRLKKVCIDYIVMLNYIIHPLILEMNITYIDE